MNGEKETNKKKKVLLYYNAYSGSGIFKNNLDHIVERIQNAGYQTIPVRTAKGVVIDEVLSNIDQSEYDRIIVAGGDGTVNLCVNAMIKHIATATMIRFVPSSKRNMMCVESIEPMMAVIQAIAAERQSTSPLFAYLNSEALVPRKLCILLQP